jgi:hypothetical protein
MLKMSNSVKEAEQRGAAELERLLKRIPQIKIKSLKIGMMQKDPGFDIQVRIEIDGIHHMLIAEVKTSGQPRYAREAILRLKAIAARSTPPAIPSSLPPFSLSQPETSVFSKGFPASTSRETPVWRSTRSI